MCIILHTAIPSMVGDLQLFYMGNSSFRSNWTTPTGTFDITNYRVQVRVDDYVLRYLTTDTFVDVELSLSGGEEIQIRVFAVSRCGEVGVSSKSPVIVYIREIGK